MAALKGRYHGRLTLIGVADVGGAPSWVHGLIRSSFRKKYPYPILLDWSGRLPAGLHCQKDSANVFLLDPTGRILATERGEYGEEARRRLMERADLTVRTE